MKRTFLCLCVSYALCLAALAAFYGMFRTERLSLFPAEASSARIYADSREGGSSTAEFFKSDSAIALRTVLHSGFYHPYAGVEFPAGSGFDDLSLCASDFSDFDSVVIVFRSNADIALVLSTVDPSISKPADPRSLRPLRLDISATRQYFEHRLPLNGLETPQIWFDVRGIERSPERFLDRVARVSVESGKGALLGLPTEIEIRKIEFIGKNGAVAGGILSILILVTILFVGGILKIYGRKEK